MDAQDVLNVVVIGSIYTLFALGLTLSWGVLNILNLAHGATFMFGGLLAYLVTAARTQVDEAAEYAPMRLLTAARRLGAAMAERASPETVRFVKGPLADMPDLRRQLRAP